MFRKILKSRQNRIILKSGFVLNQETVDLSAAGFEEIASAYRKTTTENAKKTYIYDFYKRRLG